MNNDGCTFIYRPSTTRDLDDIKSLVMACFGDRDRYDLYDNLKDRYILCVDMDKNKIVGMTSLEETDEYVDGMEIGYSCVDPEYRNRGIMTYLIGLMVNKAFGSTGKNCERIYCSAWHMPDKENANLHKILSRYGFKNIIPGRGKWIWGYNCNNINIPGKDYCVNCTLESCSCYEDLYVLEKVNWENE